MNAIVSKFQSIIDIIWIYETKRRFLEWQNAKNRIIFNLGSRWFRNSLIVLQVHSRRLTTPHTSKACRRHPQTDSEQILPPDQTLWDPWSQVASSKIKQNKTHINLFLSLFLTFNGSFIQHTNKQAQGGIWQTTLNKYIKTVDVDWFSPKNTIGSWTWRILR